MEYFGNNIANELVSDNAWKQLVQLNVFLSNLNIEGVDIQILQNLLQSSIAYAKRKVAGQFATPPQLADLLTRLTIDKKMELPSTLVVERELLLSRLILLKKNMKLVKSKLLRVSGLRTNIHFLSSYQH